MSGRAEFLSARSAMLDEGDSAIRR